jgi:pilus assembly protein CpaB
MKPAKIAIFGLSLAAMAAAMYGMRNMRPDTVVVTEKAPAAPQIQTEEVLVVKVDAPMGMVLKAEDVGWERWPTSSVQPTLLTRGNTPGGEKDLVGVMVRYNLFAGEPLRWEKLVKTDGTGFMSAILPSGKRAISIAVEGSGSDVAGGFILPNDRVDILRTFTVGSNGETTTETLLRNIRVLAIGTQVKEEDGKTTIIAGNATLELDPQQVETVTLAQRTSKLSLALRALADNNKVDENVNRKQEGLTIIRMGVPQKVGGALP